MMTCQVKRFIFQKDKSKNIVWVSYEDDLENNVDSFTFDSNNYEEFTKACNDYIWF